MVPHKIWARTRREFLGKAGLGFGALALSAMMADEARAESPEIDPLQPLAPRPGHRAPKAKSCIFLFMEGGPSHIDLFDPKPELTKRAGRAAPAQLRQVVFTARWASAATTCSPPAASFAQQHGESGTWVSDW